MADIATKRGCSFCGFVSGPTTKRCDEPGCPDPAIGLEEHIASLLARLDEVERENAELKKQLQAAQEVITAMNVRLSRG